jgi:transposase-like protein
LETEALCGAGHGERSENRINLRNGYRDRDWRTRAGTVELRIPRAATFLASWSRAEWPRKR